MPDLNRTVSTHNESAIRNNRKPCRIPKLENSQNERQSSRARSTAMRFTCALFCFFVILSLHIPAFAQQNPCAEEGPGCRPLTTTEIEALKARFLALRAALPVPDSSRWVIPDGVDEAFTMPFIAEQKYGGAMICFSWPGGCFPEDNDVSFVYEAVKKDDKPADKPKETQQQKSPEKTLEELGAAAQDILAEFANRIEINANLFPHAYLVYEVDGKCLDVSESDAVTIENSPTFLAWESGDGTRLTMIFGPRTCKEAETLRVEKPAKALAPVKSIELLVSGPNKDEVAALKQKINRKAFEALLGEIVK